MWLATAMLLLLAGESVAAVSTVVLAVEGMT